MEGISVTFPPWMVKEIDSRIERSGDRSKYIRQSVQARFNAEDADDWDDIEVEPPEKVVADGGE